MSEMVKYSKVAVELLELINYFDDALKRRIPKEFINKLNRVKSKSYSFSIDKSKSLEEQDLLPDTFKVLSAMYILYLSTPEEKLDILGSMNKKENYSGENSKKSKLQLSSIKNAYEIKENALKDVVINSAQIEEKSEDRITIDDTMTDIKENTALVDTSSFPWYKKLFANIKIMFKKILGRQE